MCVEIVSLLEYGCACFSKMNMDCLDLQWIWAVRSY